PVATTEAGGPGRAVPATSVDPPEVRRLAAGPFRFHDPDLYDRHLMFDSAVDRSRAHARQRFEAVGHAVRDLLMQRWVLTKRTQDATNAKELYYISMEFLIGRALTNNLFNLGIESFIRTRLLG